MQGDTLAAVNMIFDKKGEQQAQKFISPLSQKKPEQNGTKLKAGLESPLSQFV